MLTEERMQELAEQFEERFSAVSLRILRDIGETLKKTGDLTPSQAKKLQQMFTYGADAERMTKMLAQVSGESMEAIQRLYEQVAQEEQEWSKPFYDAKEITQIPFAENELLQNIVKAAAVVTKGELRNMSCTTTVGIKTKNGFQPLGSFYKKTVDEAISAVATGVFDYNSAVRQAIKDMGSSGLRVQYESGYTRRLDSAIRQNIIDGVSYIAQETAKQAGEEFGADGVELSAHSPCAPDHLPYQGKQYSLKEYDDLQTSLKRPIGEWNCGHFPYPILLGISRPANSKAELAEMERESNRKIEIDGKEYTRYECTQMQRKLETRLRYAREEKAIYQAAGQTELVRETTDKMRILGNKYKEVSEKAGLPTRAERLRTYGRNIEKSMESGIINKRNLRFEELGSLRLSDENLNKILQDERMLAKEIAEYAIVYDMDGNVLFRQSGEVGRVELTEDQIRKMKGAIATHNHFRGGSFSPHDIHLLKETGLAEIRACTRDGVYIMTQPDKWDERLSSYEAIEQEYKKRLKPHRDRYIEKVRAGEISKYDANIKYQQRAMDDFVKEFQLDYRFERRK